MATPTNVPYDQIPWGPPPPGVVSNFDHPENRGYWVWIVVPICTALLLPIFVLRSYTRIRITKNWWWDDTSLVLATIFTLGAMYLSVYRTTLYLGRHTWDVRLADVVGSGISVVTFTYLIVYYLSSAFVRVAVLLLSVRLFHSLPGFRKVAYGSLIFVAFYCLAALAANIYLTVPTVQKTEMSPDKVVWILRSLQTLMTAYNTVNAVVDVYLIALLIYPVHRLHLAKRKKWRIYVVFSTGILGCACAIISVVLRFHYNNDAALADLGWNSVGTEVAQHCESTLGIICACLPLVTTYFREVLKRHHTGSDSSYSIPAFIALTFAALSIRSSPRSGSNSSSRRQTRFSSRNRTAASAGDGDVIREEPDDGVPDFAGCDERSDKSDKDDSNDESNKSSNRPQNGSLGMV